ncbi:MAG: carbamoylphosphate synthase large subunit [Clostridia bacterium]|nr:carbamoylphosphate synthase large subunit [Clostridia bacterium]
MKNFVFISPNFPNNYWNFCRQLKDNGLRVLGIGDCPYEQLSAELQGSMDEYYKVSSLEDYDQVYRAVAYFIHRYGPIDWLESNNEYWLERDARLREAYHITSGFLPEDMPYVKCKSRMKERYALAGIPVARHHMVADLPGCLGFADTVGYPVVVKPDNGVGAVDTYKLSSPQELTDWFARKNDRSYIMEEFIDATINSYDAIIDSQGQPLFETGNVTVVNLMDVVNRELSSVFYIRGQLPEDVQSRGRAAVKAFGVRSRFVHMEFFRLNRDQHLGKKGDVVALEVNMRPSGGISPTMMNYANGTDVYKIWADMIAFDRTQKPVLERQYCVFVGRRDKRSYVMSREDVLLAYGQSMKEQGRVDGALSAAMGDYMFLACFKDETQLMDFIDRTCAER